MQRPGVGCVVQEGSAAALQAGQRAKSLICRSSGLGKGHSFIWSGGPFVGRFRLGGNMGLVIGRAKEGEEGKGGNCKQQGGVKQVGGKQEGADNF